MNSSLRALILLIGAVLIVAAARLLALDAFTGTEIDATNALPIEVSAVSESPASITFKLWRPGVYDIFRKAPSASTWSATPYATTAAGATSWTDSSVVVGTEYEYRFRFATGTAPLIINLYNYLRAGVKIDRTGTRGRIVLLVAADVVANLPDELARYEQDLVGDGWIVHRIETVRGDTNKASATPFNDASQFAARTQQGIRDQIKALYATHGSELKHVMILGRVPAMRAGKTYEFRPDGHGNHGARPTDFYYAELNNDSEWTDTWDNSSVYTSLTDPQRNVPGDGKLDFSRTPSNDPAFLELGFSRMDVGMMREEFASLRTWLDKVHRYRHAHPDMRPGSRTVYRDGYANIGETFWQLAPALTGLSSATALMAVPPATGTDSDSAYSAATGPYLFYFKGSSAPDNDNRGRALLWTGMQSNYGYWFDDSSMPARLGEDGMTLSWTWSIWGLRYFYHPLGTGDVMGETMRISANNRGSNLADGLYRYYGDVGNGDATGLNFMNHMGDVGLRLFHFPPPANLAVNPTGSGAELSWTASPEPGLLGYHIYRAATAAGPYTKLTTNPVAGTTYTDAATSSGTATYMVRAVKLQTTGSGTFLNPSQGIFQTVSWSAPAAIDVPAQTLPDAYFIGNYSATLTATGGVAPYAWTLTAGSLPVGLTLAPDGTLSGAATTPGTFDFTAQATDARGVSTTRALSLTVSAARLYEVPILADAQTESFNDNYNGIATTIRFSTPTNRGYFAKFDLSTLPPGTTISSAFLRVQLLDPTVPSASLSLNLTADANDGWIESTATGTSTSTDPSTFLTRNNRPPINTTPGTATFSAGLPNGSPIDVPITALVQHDLANDPARILGLTATLSTGDAYLPTKEHASATRLAPRLFVALAGGAPALNLPAAHTTLVNQSLLLDANAADDGLPGTLTYAWTTLSAPPSGTASFSTPAASATSVTFNTPGIYTLRLTATKGSLTTTSDTAVSVFAATTTAATVAPIPDLAWFQFEETSGTTVTNSVPGRPHGTLVNATATAWTASGRFGRGLDLRQESGIAHVIAANDGIYPIRPTDAWTLAFWQRKPDLNAGQYPVSKYMNPGTAVSEISLQEDNANNRMNGIVGHSSSAIGSGSPIKDGNWHLVVLRNTGTTFEVFMNQAQVYATQTSGTATNTADLLLGARRNATNTSIQNDWDGLMDDFRLYGRALTDAEIYALAAATPANLPPTVAIASPSPGTANIPLALDGSATDDALPAGSSLTYQWTQVSGPGTATFSAPTAADTTVTASLQGTYTLRLTASDGALAGTAEVSVFFESASFQLSPREITVTEGATNPFTVVLLAAPAGTVTFSVASSDTAAATVSPSSLTFTTANWATPQTVTVTGVTDAMLIDRSATITVTPTSGLPGASADTVAVTVANNTAGLVLSKSTSSVAEAGGTDTFTVALASAPASGVSVALASADTSVATVSPSSLTFTTANWATPQTVTLTGVNDSTLGNRVTNISATVTSGPAAFTALAPGTVAVTALNDDNPSVTLSASTLNQPVVTESAEDGALLTVTLGESSFITTLDPEAFTLANLPAGVTRGTVTRTSPTTATIALTGNRTQDYDSNLSVTVTIAPSQILLAASPITTAAITLTALDDTESIELRDDGWILEGAENGEILTVILTGGTFVESINSTAFTLTNLPAGVTRGTVTRVGPQHVNITLTGNRTAPYSADITNVTVTIAASQLHDTPSDLTSPINSARFRQNTSSGLLILQEGLNAYTGTTDTTLLESSPTYTGFSTSAYIYAANAAQKTYGLLRFQIPTLPAGATLTSAQLNLVATNTTTGTVTVFAATGTWAEDSANWENSNALIGSTSFGQATLPATANPLPTITLNASGLAQVQSWIDTPSTNYGFGLKSSNASTPSTSLCSSEHATQANRPKLTLTYIVPTTPAPEVNLRGNNVTIASGDTTPSTADHTDFGPADLATGTVTRTYTIQNPGDATLNLTGTPRVAISGTHAADFTVTTQPTAATIAAGGSLTFQVTFDPTAPGTRNATVTLANNDADEAAYTFAISGTGYLVASTYTVTFDASGGIGASPATKEVTVGSLYGTLATTTREGHTFLGWFTAASGGTEVTAATTVALSAAQTLYAQWEALTGYELWLESHPSLAGNHALPTADPDGDGLANLVEFALGGSPTDSGTGNQPEIATSGDRLTLGFTPAVVAGLTYTIEASSDLSDWSDASDITNLLQAGQPFTFTDSADLGSGTPRRFLRLRVTQQ